MRIRFAKKSDFQFIIKGLESNRTIEQRPTNQISATTSDKQEIKKAIEKKQIRIVEDNRNVIAFLYFRTDFSLLYVKKEFIWIDLIYVDEPYRGKGVGKMLYEDVIKIAREKNVKSLIIDIFSANKTSIGFHEKLGFESLYSIYTKEVSE